MAQNVQQCCKNGGKLWYFQSPPAEMYIPDINFSAIFPRFSQRSPMSIPPPSGPNWPDVKLVWTKICNGWAKNCVFVSHRGARVCFFFWGSYHFFPPRILLNRFITLNPPCPLEGSTSKRQHCVVGEQPTFGFVRLQGQPPPAPHRPLHCCRIRPPRRCGVFLLLGSPAWWRGHKTKCIYTALNLKVHKRCQREGYGRILEVQLHFWEFNQRVWGIFDHLHDAKQSTFMKTLVCASTCG